MVVDYTPHKPRQRAKTPVRYLYRQTATGAWRKVCRVGVDADYVITQARKRAPKALFKIGE